MNTYIAIDIGASSGRLILSTLNEQKEIVMNEIHRFKNAFSTKGNYDCWEIDYLLKQLLVGLEKVKKSGVDHCYVGMDTWAVDYCLIDKEGKRIGQPIAYRDKRTNGAVDLFSKKMPLDDLYRKTGIQIQPFNTLFQLLVEEKQVLDQADQLLLIPDYLAYELTGKMVMEKTNASTMQLLNAETKDWDEELLSILGISNELFPELVDAGTLIGEIQKEKYSDYDLPTAHFIAVASHDTASAVLGTPSEGSDWAYLSSGTWSLLGVETTQPIISEETFQANYTNEWGAHHTIRFLKNIMGMWLIQEVARMQDYQYTYAELVDEAKQVEGFQQFIDINDKRFLSPDNMIEEIQQYCRESSQTVPETAGELARCVYDNLALCYAVELQKLATLRKMSSPIKTLHIVGGGANNRFLNQLTANLSQVSVEAGPSEATAVGNLVMQMIASGELADIAEARSVVKRSFDYEIHHPEAIDPDILEQYQRFIHKEE